ncbi:MAG: hypothetical protein RIT81_37030 [Deltaproteobacteria bacterium]
MSRISHDTPMRAYDHIANLLQEAGGADGRISRADKDELIAKLEAEGRGTEALAAKNLFTMIDARDAGAGNVVTAYDLKRDRSYVEAKLLENRDVNSNGFSKAEIANMSTTGRALVELGQALAVEASRGRVAHATPERGLMHVATMIRKAAQEDLITSRDDIDAFADKLMGEGRGTEALAFRTFAGFIDNRDAAPGARITDADITKAVDYASSTMLRKKDGNDNGYSKDEIANFSKSAKAFLIIGQLVEAGVLDSSMPLEGKAVQAVLSKHFKGQEFDQMGSEGGVGMRAVHRAGSFDAVTEQSFRTAFNMPNRDIQVVDKFTANDMRTFIENNAYAYTNGKWQKDPKAADQAFDSTSVLRSLEDLKVIITGSGDQGQLATYIVGIAPDKSMVGAQTGVVWT